MVSVNDYAAFSAAVYGLYGIGQASTDKGWIRLANYSEPSGLQAALFENSAGERVLAFRGTEKFSASDWSTDLEVKNGTVPQQFDDALELYQEIATQYGTEGLSVTGHSLGGALASWVAARTETDPPYATVFNSLGIANLVPVQPYTNITNYNSLLDPVTLFGPPQIGSQYSIAGQGISPLDLATFGFLGTVAWLFLKNHLIDPIVSADFTSAQRTIINFLDPLTLDLDGDGLETTPVSAGVLFDHDGDGVAAGTGWVGSDDGLLVWDRNGNGQIDSGRELFGDSTMKSNGQLAVDGFDALADLDTNADGKINASDANFAQLKVWRDSDQDGVTDAGELSTLSSLGIAGFNTAKTANNQVLADGNRIADLGTYIRADGSTATMGDVGEMGDIDLVEDTFHRRFADQIPLTAEARLLPNMQASGLVRDTREAASLQTAEGGAFAGALASYSS
jgi:pimeloyl-ACP methyl ester carboxylesterase